MFNFHQFTISLFISSLDSHSAEFSLKDEQQNVLPSSISNFRVHDW